MGIIIPHEFGVIILAVPEGAVMNTEQPIFDAFQRIRNCDESVIDTFWEFLPSPYEIGVENREAACLVLRKICESALNQSLK